MPTPQYRPEQLPQERTARWARSIFPMGLEGASPNPSMVGVSASEQQATVRGTTPSTGTVMSNIKFHYDYMIV